MTDTHTSPQVPPHIPPELVREFNYLDSSSDTDVYRYFARLHDGPDIFYTTCNHGHWVFTRYVDIEYVLQHSEDFSSKAHTNHVSEDTAPLYRTDTG